MTHQEIENLASDYLEGLLEVKQQAAVEFHLADCPSCRDLIADVSQVMQLCRRSEDAEPVPWLVAKIMRATVGDRKPSWREKLANFFRPVLHPRIAYPIAMTVFTFSVLVNAAGLNLRNLRFEDLNPRTWADRANRQGHLMAARAEKFYYDLRVVYEIESRFRALGGESAGQPEAAPSAEPPAGGSSQSLPAEQITASNARALVGPGVPREPEFQLIAEPNRTHTERSEIP